MVLDDIVEFLAIIFGAFEGKLFWILFAILVLFLVIKLVFKV